jgi:hypothetical protein
VDRGNVLNEIEARGIRPDVWAAVAILLALCGCATSPADWIKPGATRAELRRDLADCQRDATGPPPFHFRALDENYETARHRAVRLKHQCMEARGWRMARAEDPIP